MKYVVTVQGDVAGISHTYLPRTAAIFLLLVACDQVPLILPKMQEFKWLMLRWCSFLECSRACKSGHFTPQGSQYVKNQLWWTNGNISQLSVAYLNATIHVRPEMHIRRLEPTGEAKPDGTHSLTGTDTSLACYESVGWVFKWDRNWTHPIWWSKPELLAH
jgi:hypothetical protein